MTGLAHIAIVDPGKKYPELDTFNVMNALYKGAVPLSYHQPALFGLDSLHQRRDSLVGMVILGSSASVYDDLPWQAPLHASIDSLVRQGIPTLGICYGHQLLAQLFGGKVSFMSPDRTKLKGFRPIVLQDNRLWQTSDLTGELVVSHAEAVTDVPRDFQVIAASPNVSCEAMEHRSLPIWSFQAHPEATAGFMLNQAIPFDGDESRFHFGHRLVQRFLIQVASRSFLPSHR